MNAIIVLTNPKLKNLLEAKQFEVQPLSFDTFFEILDKGK